MRKAKRLIIILFSAFLLLCSKGEVTSANDLGNQFSQETADWLRWFMSLPPEDRICVNYRPPELADFPEYSFYDFLDTELLLSQSVGFNYHDATNELVPVDPQPGIAGKIHSGYN